MYSGRGIEEVTSRRFDFAGRDIRMRTAMKNPQQFERSVESFQRMSGSRNIGVVQTNLMNQPASASDGQADNRLM